jgi:K+-transporting ATPase KdpF subunit
MNSDKWRRTSGQHFLCRRLRGYAHGSRLSGYHSDIFSAVRLADFDAGATVTEGMAMNVMYVLGGILSLGLLVYLMVALLKPEWF